MHRSSLLLVFTTAYTLSLFWLPTAAHVRLNWPLARTYDFDFLDNVRTPSPCGVPSSIGGPVTFFQTGQTVNVTWHLAYAHRGGFKLEILEGDEVIHKLTGEDFLSEEDTTRQSWTVSLPPDYTCDRCALRLLRRAAEWGGQYTFWSCADITISSDGVCNSNPETGDKCSGGGDCVDDKCVCDGDREGDYCQYIDECERDEDCNGHGFCLDIDPTTFPKKQCFCENGWFGKKCNKENPSNFNIEIISKETHAHRELTEGFNIYWRILEDIGEIEVAMEVNSTTWVALGWRPQGMADSCRDWPVNQLDVVLPPNPESEGEATSEPESEGEDTSEPESEGEATSEPESEGEATSEPESEGEDSSEPESEGEATSEPESEGEATSEPESEGEATSEPESEGKATSEPESEGEASEPESEGEATSEPESEGKATSEPESEGEANSEPESEGEANSEPESEGEATSEPESKGEATSEPESEGEASEPESEGEATSEPESEGEATSEPESEGEATSEPESEGEDSSEPESEGEDSSEPESEGEATSEPESEGEATSEPESEGEDSSEPESDGEDSSEPESEGEDSYEPESEGEDSSEPESEGEDSEPETDSEETGSNLHPMDCVDITIGYVREGSLSRILDYYTTGRATPNLDEWYPGHSDFDDITAATGKEEDGITKIIFRKKLSSSEKQDHDFLNEFMHVIWARGQEIGSYFHNPTSGIERGTASDELFYRQDELKYHGTASSQRGSLSLNFYDTGIIEAPEDGPCHGEFTIPSDCDGDSCDYKATWDYDETSNDIIFEITTNFAGDDNNPRWTAIGFSDDQYMANTDVILAYITTDGVYEVTDRFNTGYSPPAVDDSNDVEMISGIRSDGRTTMSFKRKRKTGDPKDLDFEDNLCHRMFFVFDGGSVSSNGALSKHASTPAISPDLICIQSCSLEISTISPTTKSSIDTVYKVEFKLEKVGDKTLNFTDNLRDPTSEEFEILANTVCDSVSAIFGINSNVELFYKGCSVVEFIQGSVIVIYEVIFDNEAEITQMDVMETFINGTIALTNLTIDKSSVSVLDITPTKTMAVTAANVPQEEDKLCLGEWSYPEGCTGDCLYSAKWDYDGITDKVSFEIKAKTAESDEKEPKWLGIGFSHDKEKIATDYVIGWLMDDNQWEITDGFVGTSSYKLNIDLENNLEDASIYRESSGTDYTIMKFKRQRNTRDGQDVPLDKCVYMIFEINGGPVKNHYEMSVDFVETSIYTNEKVCIQECTENLAYQAGNSVKFNGITIVFLTIMSYFINTL